ncbi:SurA N-terminal domain-containing protein [Aliifodinibius sp. S!AR15-10]|uniref:SurA N-terminal domain-containing protein n=1 Tax=Aliifodinibius sp. S!AR15-10 TaxID=2950437 RepID=UPI0028630CA3|nr:SurA N-terminal domain-containing protein [Aliifodinibius sp. S!AR15-10]MDR8392689.1 SurA N-terminal domain-containing protein [Aliifodinibius sp. S!AR15-10]
MRKNTGVILWVLIFSFGVLWILADTQVFDALQAGPRSLGSVNGEPISLEEYNSRISGYIDRYSQQTGNSITPEMRAYYEDQAWNELVTSKLVQQKMNELGISVTDQEVVEMITGENPDPFIRQQFQREDGTIDRVALQAAIEAPENSQLWVMIEQQLRQKRRQQKMNNFVQSSMVVSSHEVEQQYLRNNTTADISYIRFPYAEVPDSAVNVTESDLREFYENNQRRYEQKESYRFKYVSFDKTPTSEDTTRTFRELRNIRDEFAQAEDDSLFLFQQQSTTPYSAEFVDKSEIREEFTPVLDLENGEVSEPIQTGGKVNILKKIDETADQVKFVVLSYDIRADPINTIDARAEEADDFSYFAEQEGFETEAENDGLQVKEAFATKDNPFVAGIGQSRQILNYLETSSEGDISQPLELSSQFIVLKVEEITPEGVRPFEEVKQQIQNQVLNEKRKEQIAQRVQGLLDSNSTLESLSSAAGKELVTQAGLRKSSVVIQGAGREPEVIGAVFGLDEGETSGILQGNSAVFVVRVDGKQEANLQNLTTSTRQQIRQQLQQEKGKSFMQVWMEQLRADADIEDNRAQLLRQG